MNWERERDGKKETILDVSPWVHDHHGTIPDANLMYFTIVGAKKFEKVYIPVKDYPEINFLGECFAAELQCRSAFAG